MINQTTRQFLKFLAEELEKQSSLDEVCDINIAFEYEFQAMIILFKLVVYTFYWWVLIYLRHLIHRSLMFYSQFVSRTCKWLPHQMFAQLLMIFRVASIHFWSFAHRIRGTLTVYCALLLSHFFNAIRSKYTAKSFAQYLSYTSFLPFIISLILDWLKLLQAARSLMSTIPLP